MSNVCKHPNCTARPYLDGLCRQDFKRATRARRTVAAQEAEIAAESDDQDDQAPEGHDDDERAPE